MNEHITYSVELDENKIPIVKDLFGDRIMPGTYFVYAQAAASQAYLKFYQLEKFTFGKPDYNGRINVRLRCNEIKTRDVKYWSFTGNKKPKSSLHANLCTGKALIVIPDEELVEKLEPFNRKEDDDGN